MLINLTSKDDNSFSATSTPELLIAYRRLHNRSEGTMRNRRVTDGVCVFSYCETWSRFFVW